MMFQICPNIRELSGFIFNFIKKAQSTADAANLDEIAFAHNACFVH